MGEVRVDSRDGVTIPIGCEGGPPCVDLERGCKACRAPGPERGCGTCAELARQHGGAMPAGGWCLMLHRKKDNHDFVHVTMPFRVAKTGHLTGETTFACPYRSGELPPPWCAAPGADEKAVEAGRNAFVLALPEALRDGALVAAEKANAKRCMTWHQKAEPVKPKRGKTDADNQTKMF